MELLERLKKIKNRYDKVNEQLSDSAITSDREKMINLSRERSDLEEIISAYETYSKIVNDIEGNKEIINSKILILLFSLKFEIILAIFLANSKDWIESYQIPLFLE